jgi:hypothetical protein
MGKQDKKEVKAVPTLKLKKEGPARRKRNTFQRKCLSKASKRMFAGCVSAVRVKLLAFEQRNKARTTG